MVEAGEEKKRKGNNEVFSGDADADSCLCIYIHTCVCVSEKQHALSVLTG